MKYLIIHNAFVPEPVLGYFGLVPEDWLVNSDDSLGILERVFGKHNADERPDRFMRPSLSSNSISKDAIGGDLVVLFDELERSYSVWECRPMGWELTPTTRWPRTQKWNDIYELVEELGTGKN